MGHRKADEIIGALARAKEHALEGAPYTRRLSERDTVWARNQQEWGYTLWNTDLAVFHMAGGRELMRLCFPRSWPTQLTRSRLHHFYSGASLMPGGGGWEIVRRDHKWRTLEAWDVTGLWLEFWGGRPVRVEGEDGKWRHWPEGVKYARPYCDRPTWLSEGGPVAVGGAVDVKVEGESLVVLNGGAERVIRACESEENFLRHRRLCGALYREGLLNPTFVRRHQRAVKVCAAAMWAQELREKAA